MKKIFVLLFFLSGFSPAAYSQAGASSDSIPLTRAVSLIHEHYQVDFIYKTEWFDPYKTLMPSGFSGLEHDLGFVLKGLPFSFINYKDIFIIFYKNQEAALNMYDTSYRPAATGPDILYKLDGMVVDVKDETPVIGATVYIPALKKGTVTDINGSFRFNLPAGTYYMQIQSVGYVSQTEKVVIDKDQSKTFFLPKEVHLLNEVVISGKPNENIYETMAGLSRLSVSEMDVQPALMGETDIIKSILMLQGVSTVGEAATGFNVRGGSADQNLVIMDEAPLFNSSHVFGLFSTFNEDMVDQVTLMRSGIPPRYGGRLSSVLEVKTKSNQVNRLAGEGGIGLFASRLTLEVPVIKDHLTILAGGRSLYSDFLLGMINNKSIKNSNAFFYDGNIKMNLKIMKSSQVFYTFYKSYDQFKLPTDTLFRWGSENHSLTYNQLIGKKLAVNLTGVYCKYRYGMSEDMPRIAFDWNAGIDYKEAKVNFFYQPDKSNRIDFGGGTAWYKFIQGSLVPGKESSLYPVKIEDMYGQEKYAYASDEFDLFSFIRIMAGVRYSQFSQTGPGTIHIYQAGVPESRETITGSRVYGKGEKISNDQGLAPRLAVRILINDMNSVKLSYNRQYQYIQQLSNTTGVTPIDLWFPSGAYLRPQMGDQVSLGYFRNFHLNTYEASLEVYYKKLYNQIDYKNGAELLVNPDVESEILQGDGRAFGLEFYVKKNLGRLTGMVSYTYARTLRRMKGPTAEETINDGNYYPAPFDIPNDFKITASYKLNRRWYASGNFVYNTGHPATFPVVKYQDDYIVIAQYSDRNLERIPDYHRLDLSITMKGNNRRNKFLDANWTFTLYNVYARKNAYLIYFKPIPGTEVPQGFKYSFLGTIIPSLSYNFRFL